MPGCNALAGFAAGAAGDDDRYEGACDDEVAGAIAAWDQIEAHAAARKHAAVAEFIRRRPAPGCAPEGPARMPAAWEEFTARELGSVLGESRGAAEGLLDLAYVLEVKLPGTRAAFRDGTLRQSKAEIITRATTVLDPWTARWTSCGPAPTSTSCWTKTPAPARTPQAGRPPTAGMPPAETAPGRTAPEMGIRTVRTRRAGEDAGNRRRAGWVRRPGQPGRPAGDPAGPG